MPLPRVFGFCMPLLFAATFASCSSSFTGDPQPSARALFSPSITAVTIEIDYQPGAEPYTGGVGRLKDVWQISNDNVQRIFLHSPKTIGLPTTLAQMQPLDDVTKTSFTNDDVLAIATKHRGTKSNGDTATFYVVFLNGTFDDGSGPQNDVLGVSIGTTGVIAMFKPVIATTETTSPGVSRFVEQSTLVHELGHAFGLVNDGLAMAAPHEDASHKAHCTNQKCAMYWANEGAASAVAYVRQVLITGSNVLYGPECLADADAAAAQ